MLENPLGSYPTLNDKTDLKKKKRAKKRPTIISNSINTIEVPLEIEEQKTLVDYCEAMGFLSWATPNAGKRGKTAQRNAKKEGIVAGVSDYTVMLKDKILFIEMKRRPRKLKSGKYSVAHTETSPEQKAFIERAGSHAYANAKICFGAVEAIEFIKSNL